MPLPIKFGVSTWLFTSPFQTSSIEELFPKIAEMGFDAVEIAVEDPALIDGEAVKSALQKYNLKAIVCGAFGPTRDLTNMIRLFIRSALNTLKNVWIYVLCGIPAFLPALCIRQSVRRVCYRRRNGKRSGTLL